MIEKEEILTVGQKVSLSIFLSLLIFAITIVFSQTGLQSQLEKAVYSQAKVQEKQKYLTEISVGCEHYLTEIYKAIYDDENAYLRNRYVESYLKMEPNESDTSNRRRLTENLFLQFEGLVGLRVIDDRMNVCYSTFYENDITSVEENKNQNNYLRFKNYNDIAEEEKLLAYDALKVEGTHHLATKIIMDTTRNELVFSVYFQPRSLVNNVNSIKSADFVFYFDLNSFETRLLENRILNFGDRLMPVSTMKNTDLFGFLVTQNYENQQDVKNSVLHLWNLYRRDDRGNHFRMENVFEQQDGTVLVLLSVPSEGRTFNLSGVYDSAIFTLPKEISIIVYICLLISVQLIIFFILSLKADYSIVIKRRIKRLQFEIITQFLDDKSELNWEMIASQIESKKTSFSEDIKKSFGKKGKKYSAQIDAVLENSWADIISVLKGSSNLSGQDNMMKEIKKMLEDIVNNGNLRYKASNVINPATVIINQPQTELEEVELVEAVETVHKKDDTNKSVIPDSVHLYSDAEPVSVIDHDSDSLSDDSDEIEEIEMLDELDNSDVQNSLDEAEEIEEIEEIEDADELEEVEEIEEAEEVEEIDEIEEAESVDNAVGVKPKKNKKVIYYEEDDDTYVYTEEVVFPTVDNVFAEELCLGREYVSYSLSAAEAVDFNITLPDFNLFSTESGEEPAEAAIEKTEAPSEDEEILECEELSNGSCYSMTQFGASAVVTDLDSQENNTIIEKDGVFSIAEDLNYTDVIQDESFKSLVDSVLK